MITKDDLPTELTTPRTVIRRTVPRDLPEITAWPPYPWPYNYFDMTDERARSPGGAYWWEQIDDPDRCHYSVVLPERDQIIGVHAFVSIDWFKATVGNMGIRIRTDLCNQGHATETLAPLLKAVLGSGIGSIRLDVAATNQRAIRCYEKCGLQIVDELWRKGTGPSDLADPKWTPMIPHLRRDGGKWMVRFYWMEICKANF